MAECCPYCGKEIEGAICQKWEGNHLNFFDFECSECGETMEVEVELIPVFLAYKKFVPGGK